jgi:Flp pilus assembly protein TadD
LVVTGDRNQPAWGGRVFNLRVEDHPEPLMELRRLLTMNRAYNLVTQGDEHLTEGNIEMAVAAFSAAEALAPNNHEMVFWHAVTLAGAGQVEQALPLFEKAFSLWPKWRELIPRLPASGLLPDDPELLAEILEAK